MKLISMTATFGCLAHETLTFSDGLTLIGAPNGRGKSTWCAFLRTMLYGLDTRQRDRKGAPADKNRYRPWSGAPMEGLLVCEHEGQLIELRRTSADGVPMGTFSATYRADGRPVPGLTAENAGEVLTGVGRDVFDRSVFLRQTGLAVSQSQELERRIAALVSTGEEDVSWTEADERLRSWQHRRRYHRTGLIPQREEEAAALCESLDRTDALRRELARLEARADDLHRQKADWDARLTTETDQFHTVARQRCAEAAAELERAEQRLADLDAARPEPGADHAEDLMEEMAEIRDDLRGRCRLMGVFTVVIVLLTLLAAALYVLPRHHEALGIAALPLDLPLVPLALLAALVGALWVLVLLFTIIKAVCDRKDRRELRTLQEGLSGREEAIRGHDRDREEALRHRDQARKYYETVSAQSTGGPWVPPEAEACRESLGTVAQEIASVRGQLQVLGDPVLADARLDELDEELTALQADYDALDIAQEALREADRQLQARFSPQLSERAGAYFSALTAGRYTEVSLDRDLQVTVREGDGLADRPLALLSQGTADQLYLALRLAVADLLLPSQESCPVVLDDALAAFDDDRLALALDTLCAVAGERQVKRITCQHRELELLADRPGVSVRRLGDF